MVARSSWFWRHTPRQREGAFEMMTGYTKLFSSIIASTIWRESKEIKIVWITMLALANRFGIVEASVPGLADMARVSVQEVEAALQVLQNPDPYSRSKEDDGRRIKPVDGGWLLINFTKYRAKMSEDDRRAYLREKKRQERESKRCQQPVNKRPTLSRLSTQSESESESESESKAEPEAEELQPSLVLERTGTAKPFTKPTATEMELQAAKIGLPPAEIQHFYDHYESNGWKVGRNPMKSWQAAMSNWKRNLQTYANGSSSNLRGHTANSRNTGVCKAGPDYSELAKRKLQKQDAQRNGQVALPLVGPTARPGQPPPTPATP